MSLSTGIHSLGSNEQVLCTLRFACTFISDSGVLQWNMGVL